MKHPERFQRAARWTWHGLRLVPRLVRLRHQKRTAAPPLPNSPYRRFFTENRSFEELARRGRPRK